MIGERGEGGGGELPGGKVKINGMTEVGLTSGGGTVNLGLALLQTRQDLSSKITVTL